MGNLSTNTSMFATKTTFKSLRSKGERLGWKSLKEQTKCSLRDIVGDGEKVDPHKYSYVDSSIKLLIP